MVGEVEGGLIERCLSQASVGADDSVRYAGGFVGKVGDRSGGSPANHGEGAGVGVILDSYATGDVSVEDHAGGFVGLNESVIRRSYSLGDATASDDGAGGFVSINEGTITDSYATGVGTDSSGYGAGFAYYTGSGSTTVNCWWYNTTNTVGIYNSNGTDDVTKATTDESDFYDAAHDVYTRADYEWDFDGEDADWVEDVSQADYPSLFWEI